MKIFTILIVIVIFSCNPKTLKNNALEELELKLTIEYTSDYCGGAYPPEEMIKNLKTLKPFRNTELILLNASKDFKETVKTDDQGQINKSFPSGKYEIFFPNKINATPANRAISEERCLEWKKTPDALFELSAEQTSFNLQMHKSCNPCEPPRP